MIGHGANCAKTAWAVKWLRMGVRTRVGKEEVGREKALTVCLKVAAGQLVVEDDRMAQAV